MESIQLEKLTLKMASNVQKNCHTCVIYDDRHDKKSIFFAPLGRGEPREQILGVCKKKTCIILYIYIFFLICNTTQNDVRISLNKLMHLITLARISSGHPFHIELKSFFLKNSNPVFVLTRIMFIT